MKRLIIIGFSVVIVLAFILLFLQHTQSFRDRKFRQKLSGAWSWEIYSLHGTRNYAADGSFTEQVFKGTNSYNLTAGTWYVKDDKVIVTFTSDSNKKAQIPRTSSEQIIRIDAHEFVGTFGATKVVLNKVTP
jgi:uncharacterized protein YpmB